MGVGVREVGLGVVTGEGVLRSREAVASREAVGDSRPLEFGESFAAGESGREAGESRPDDCWGVAVRAGVASPVGVGVRTGVGVLCIGLGDGGLSAKEACDAKGDCSGDGILTGNAGVPGLLR